LICTKNIIGFEKRIFVLFLQRKKNIIMDLKKIITSAGEPDLFKIISSNPKGLIVEALQSQKRQQVFAHQRINSLDDIAVFTQTGEIPLREVFVRLYKYTNQSTAVDSKVDGIELKDYFEKFFPEYDREKVKMSAMKKMIKWYNMLIDKQLIDDKIEEPVENTDQEIENKEDK